MAQLIQLQQLAESNRWTFFLESTAAGLQVNLTMLPPEGRPRFQTETACAACSREYAPLVQSELDSLQELIRINPKGGEFSTALGTVAIVLPILEGINIAVRDCDCREGQTKLALRERANIVRQLLSSFQAALTESQAGGQRAVELSTLRRMNRIILSMFQKGQKAMEHAFDLILSALIILSGAQGSWLEYRRGTEHFLLLKGDEEAVRSHLLQQDGKALSVPLPNSRLEGRLGVLAPADNGQASSLLSLLVEECVIVFEIEYLFQLVRTQIKLVLGSLSSAILLVDQHGVISYVNCAAEQLLGQQFLQLAGIPAASVDAPWASSLAGKPTKKLMKQMDILGKGAGQSWVDWQLHPLLDGEEPLGWLVVADNRTDYYHWQKTGRQAERMANTSTMVGTLAHELRNPLSAARGLLQLTGSKRDPEKIAGYNNLIIRELDRVTRLLNEFLLLGRTAEKTGEPLDLFVFLQELLPLLSGEAGGLTIDVITDLEAVPPVFADQGQLTQVVLNLMRNAVEAVEEHGSIILRLRSMGDTVLLEIEDTGAGMTQEVLSEIFRPFYTTKERGTGLGLAVSQAIIHNSGGKITASNVPGGGALFSISLPAYQQTGSADVVIAIMDEILKFPVEYTLRTAGFKTVSAPGADDVHLLAKEHMPAVVVLELTGLRGETVEKVMASRPGVKIMAIGDTGCFQSMKNVVFVPKPLDYAHLVLQIRETIATLE